MIAKNNLEGKFIDNIYNDKPLVILAGSGVIILPVHFGEVMITEISDENSFVTCDMSYITSNLVRVFLSSIIPLIEKTAVRFSKHDRDCL
ncbi:MAG: hypothetical protein IKF80_10610 [Erysipelotrichaceae bacterium]|nr:hypothetical protein [Erysipelotrichaceae bacterium]